MARDDIERGIKNSCMVANTCTRILNSQLGTVACQALSGRGACDAVF